MATKVKPNKVKSNNNGSAKQPTKTSMLIPATASFNRNAAVNYAHTWWDNFNPAYIEFSEDCTNFVSQCWNEAGIPMNSYWYNYVDSNSYTYSWSLVNNFHSYMINNGWCYSGAESQAQLGDVIQLYNSNENDWSHSMIVPF